jgi:hypothetical protein
MSIDLTEKKIIQKKKNVTKYLNSKNYQKISTFIYDNESEKKNA